jgi:hypothetical protein
VSRAEKVLNNMSEDANSDIDLVGSLALNTQVVPLNTLLQQIEASLGKNAGAEFRELVFQQSYPKDPDQLIKFFQNKSDIASRIYLKQLEKNNDRPST